MMLQGIILLAIKKFYGNLVIIFIQILDIRTKILIDVDTIDHFRKLLGEM